MTARRKKSAPTVSRGLNASPPRASSRGSTWRQGALLALLVAGIDQAVKALVLRTLPPDASVPLIPGVLSLTYVRNTGIAFGLLSGVPLAVTVLAALTVVFLIVYNEGHWLRDPLSRAAAGLLLGGAAGNLSDRFRLGYVVDYLDLRVWPVFNLADTAVVCGGALLLWALFRRKRGEA